MNAVTPNSSTASTKYSYLRKLRQWIGFAFYPQQISLHRVCTLPDGEHPSDIEVVAPRYAVKHEQDQSKPTDAPCIGLFDWESGNNPRLRRPPWLFHVGHRTRRSGLQGVGAQMQQHDRFTGAWRHAECDTGK